VVDGSYSITASADGFVSQDYNRDATPEGAFLRVDSSTRIQGIDFHLAHEAVISGAVVDEAGKPVVNVPVTAVGLQGKDRKPGHVGLRQFERSFVREVGASPKSFARIARFQSAFDAKLVSPQRTWLDIAHSFGYHDQMHMIHDFEALGRTTPTHLIAQMADVRPPALVAEENI
jgi:hypothetical protein